MYEINFGWRPDYPDYRDYTMEKNDISKKKQELGVDIPVKELLDKIGINSEKKIKNKMIKDIREYCSKIEDQGSLGSCTAQAAVGALEYFEKKAHGRYIDASRLFVYKATRNLLGWTGDTGAYNRTTMAAMVLFGAPPEHYWPYVIDNFDVEPTAFLYNFAQNYQTIQYYKLDSPGISRDKLLLRIKQHIAYKIPVIFGFSVYSSYTQAEDNEGKIPYPAEGESRVGGHAVLAVGYDDEIEIKNDSSDDIKNGALLFRNSWGEGWGKEGYGWLPYDYILDYLAIDWWTLIKAEWVDTGEFNLG